MTTPHPLYCHVDSAENQLTGLQPPHELSEVLEGFLNRKALEKNWLVGRGLVLQAPFSFRTDTQEAHHRVEISGYLDGVPVSETVRCRRAVIGRFRPQITFLDASGGTMNFRRLAPLRPLHIKLLSGVAPGSSISKAQFDKLTSTISSRNEPMTDGPRRWRELRTEYGFDVSVVGNLYYRGSSIVPIAEPQPRPDMAGLRKQMAPELLERGAPLRCNKCARAIALERAGEDFPGLIDHRRPVLFGGSDELDNLQFFCQQCNNLKARVCNACPLGYRCEACTWAYPEDFHDTLVIHLTPEMASALKLLSAGSAETVEQLAESAIRALLIK